MIGKIRLPIPLTAVYLMLVLVAVVYLYVNDAMRIPQKAHEENKVAIKAGINPGPDTKTALFTMPGRFTFTYPKTLRAIDLMTLPQAGEMRLFNYAYDKYEEGEKLKKGDFRIEMMIYQPGGKTVEEYLSESDPEGKYKDERQISKGKIGNREAVIDSLRESSLKAFWVPLKDGSILALIVHPLEGADHPEVKRILSSFLFE